MYTHIFTMFSYMCIYMYIKIDIYIYNIYVYMIFVYVYVYIYIYRERERDNVCSFFFSLVCSKQYFNRTQSCIKLWKIQELEECLGVYLSRSGNMRVS